MGGVQGQPVDLMREGLVSALAEYRRESRPAAGGLGGELQIHIQKKHILHALTQKANTHSDCLLGQKRCQGTSC